MITLPVDMLAAAGSMPPAEEWLLACVKMPSSDVWLSDRPASPELRALLPAEPLAAIEDWGMLDDGGTVDGLLSTGSAGNLECPTVKITVLRADQTKTQIDAIINQGIHNRRIELYRWFTGMTSAPVLIDTLFVQDKIELAESSMLWSFEAVGCLAAENPRMSELDDKGRSWPYVIGRAQGIPLTLLESESSKWTELIGDADGNEVTAEYTGLIRVKDATKLRSGSHLINGETVSLSTASAGYMRLTGRGVLPQEHSSGSRIFPVGAVFKYAVCAGPVGSFEKLRTSNEIDVYDDDGDGDTAEYRDLYSGGNEEYHPDLNPAQIWFNDRMPFLWKNQDNQVDDRKFYGSGWTSYYGNRANEINRDGGAASVLVNFRRFNDPVADYWYKDTTIPLPSFSGEGSGATTFAASDNIVNNLGYFSVNQSFGEYIDNMSSTAWREFRVNSTCPPGEEGWVMIEPEMPDLKEFVFTATGNYWAIIFQRVVTKRMAIRIDIYEVDKSGAEFALFSATHLGAFLDETEWYPLGYSTSQPFVNYDAYTTNRRVKLKITCLVNNASDSYAFMRIGGTSIYSEKYHYGMAAFWRYYDSAPSAYITSTFGKNLSRLGTFQSAKISISGKLLNSQNLAANGSVVRVYENDSEVNSTSLADANETTYSQEITLSAATWEELRDTEIKIETQLDYFYVTNESSWQGIPRTDGSAGIELDDGIRWLITYNSNTLDGLQVNYADTLYVDAVSTRGPDWTPARALRWISEDKTTWAADMLDADALDDRHAEYTAAGHVLNGLRAEERYQDVIREVLRQGFARPVQCGGKLSIVNHLTDAAALPVMAAALDDLFSKSQTFTTTDTPQLVQKIILNYNKNLSTGEWDDKHELATGQPVQELAQIDLDMISSAAAVQLAAAWLYALKTVQLQVFGYAGNFRMISAQKSDKINLPSFLLDNALCEMLTANIKQDFGKGKTGKMTKFLIQAIRRA